MGSILVKDEKGNLKPDFGLHKRHFKKPQPKTQSMSEEERNKRLEQMRADGERMREEKMTQHKKDYAHENADTKG